MGVIDCVGDSSSDININFITEGIFTFLATAWANLVNFNDGKYFGGFLG